LERQKRISVDGEDYHLDLLFFHRKLKRLVAIDLKLGKFKPAYKGQNELYLCWLEKQEVQTGEKKPIGLLLCSEGNTEHIELLILNEPDIKISPLPCRTARQTMVCRQNCIKPKNWQVWLNP